MGYTFYGQNAKKFLVFANVYFNEYRVQVLKKNKKL